MNVDVSIGIVSYSDLHYLQKIFLAIFDQKFSNFEVLIFDNNLKIDIYKWIKKNYPNIKIYRKNKNLGFSKAHNYLIDKAKGKYYLCLNSDVYLTPDYLNLLVKKCEEDEKIGAISGTILKWNEFPKIPILDKDNKIDSLGLALYQNHQVKDIGQGKTFNNNDIKSKEVWGVSAACVLYRIDALKEISYKKEFFDENFFMYKEDVDLAYRLRWYGWKAFYLKEAICFHDRTTFSHSNVIKFLFQRFKMYKNVKINSFVNHILMIVKNFDDDYSFKTKVKTYLFVLAHFILTLFSAPGILFELKSLKLKINQAKEKKIKIVKKISCFEMSKWFSLS